METSNCKNVWSQVDDIFTGDWRREMNQSGIKRVWIPSLLIRLFFHRPLSCFLLNSVFCNAWKTINSFATPLCSTSPDRPIWLPTNKSARWCVYLKFLCSNVEQRSKLFLLTRWQSMQKQKTRKNVNIFFGKLKKGNQMNKI